MYKAKVIRNFTWAKRANQLFETTQWINDLTEEDMNYLKANNVITDITFVADKEEVLEKAVVEEKKVEKAVKKPVAKKKK